MVKFESVFSHFLAYYDRLAAIAWQFMNLGLQMDGDLLISWREKDEGFALELVKLSNGKQSRQWLVTLLKTSSHEGRELLLEASGA